MLNRSNPLKQMIQPNGGVSEGAELGWYLLNARYDSKSFAVASQDTNPYGITLSTDGSKLYVIGNSHKVYQYSLSTNWDISTASYDTISFDTTSQSNNIKGISFSPDGLKMYIISSYPDYVYQYTLSTAWDVSSASYSTKSFSIASQETLACGLFFAPSGTKMYIVGTVNNTVYQYTLSTAWDVSSASYDSKSFNTTLGEAWDVYFKTDGTKMYVLDGKNLDTGRAVFQYLLSTPWDVSTASYSNITHEVKDQESYPKGITFNGGGTAMYIIGTNSDTIYQYDLIPI